MTSQGACSTPAASMKTPAMNTMLNSAVRTADQSPSCVIGFDTSYIPTLAVRLHIRVPTGLSRTTYLSTLFSPSIEGALLYCPQCTLVLIRSFGALLDAQEQPSLHDKVG